MSRKLTAGHPRERERGYAQIPVLKSGVYAEYTNLSNRAESQRMLIVCPICFTSFHRPPSHVDRVAVATCGLGCAAEARKVRIETFCVTCGTSMSQTPSNAARVITCSKKCSSIRRRKGCKRFYSWVIYKRGAEQVVERQRCTKCGTNVGPWVVRGLNPHLVDDDLELDEAAAELWCKHCHLTDIAPLGSVVRDAKR